MSVPEAPALRAWPCSSPRVWLQKDACCLRAVSALGAGRPAFSYRIFT